MSSLIDTGQKASGTGSSIVVSSDDPRLNLKDFYDPSSGRQPYIGEMVLYTVPNNDIYGTTSVISSPWGGNNPAGGNMSPVSAEGAQQVLKQNMGNIQNYYLHWFTGPGHAPASIVTNPDGTIKGVQTGDSFMDSSQDSGVKAYNKSILAASQTLSDLTGKTGNFSPKVQPQYLQFNPTASNLDKSNYTPAMQQTLANGFAGMVDLGNGEYVPKGSAGDPSSATHLMSPSPADLPQAPTGQLLSKAIPSTATPSFPTTALQPGATGAAVKQLQDYLVSIGIMTQDQVNTGYGTYGPQTTAAVAKLQQSLGVDNSTGVGYWGPRTLSAIQTATTASGSQPGATGSTGATGAGAGDGVTFNSTGDSALDAILAQLKGVADGLLKTGYTMPANLQITPDLVSTFLNFAHQVVDPYTQQQISSRLADVNSNLKALGTTYGNDMTQAIQEFGTSLATEQNNSGGNGTAFSGLRGLTENNMAASTNRSLSTLGATAGYNIGSAARAAASDVGAANAGGIVLPSLSTGSVSLAGGSRGSSGLGGGLDYGYNPSIYGVGKIPSDANTNVANTEASYLSQYGTLANAQSGGNRSMKDLIGMMSGLPSNYSVPSSLT